MLDLEARNDRKWLKLDQFFVGEGCKALYKQNTIEVVSLFFSFKGAFWLVIRKVWKLKLKQWLFPQ